MKAIGVSVKGSRSEFNEDAYLVDHGRQVFIVADGVGSGPDGHEASRKVVESLSSSMRASVGVRDGLLSGIELANTSVHALASTKSRTGMASTLVCALAGEAGIEVFHAGDSRAYRLRNGRLQVLTADHSKLIQREGGQKEVVTRAVGARATLEVDGRLHEYRQGDVYALCSDGISDPLQETVIESVLGDTEMGMLDKCRKLVRLAEEAGGQDDKTIIIFA